MVPEIELTRRIGKLQQALQKEEIAGALIIQRADLYYFSGTGQNAHLFVPSEGEATLLVKKSMIRAGEESSLKEIRPFESWDNLKKTVTDKLDKGSKIGLELDVLPTNLYYRYKKLFQDCHIVDISKSIRLIRSIKSDYELALLGEAAKISAAVFEHAGSLIRENLSEIDLAAGLEAKARSLGHQGAVRMRGFNQELYFGHIMSGPSATTISFFDGPTGGSGLNPSYPQGAGPALIRRGDPILVDFVSIFDGYMIDQTRIFCIGEPAPHLKKAYDQALEIRNTLVKRGKPGISCGELYNDALQAAAEAGLEDYFMGYIHKVPFVGHGVGLELDELPVIAKHVQEPLREKMVFALEPKFIFPGEGTVGIEDTFVVKPEGLERLTLTGDELVIV